MDVLAIGTAAGCLADAGIEHAPWDGEGDRLATAGVVVSPPDWVRLRAWRVAGYTTPVVVVLGGSARPDERAPFEPLFLVEQADPGALRHAITAVRTSRPTGHLPLTLGVVDLARRVLAGVDGDVSLSRLETDLLAYLAARRGADVSRDELLTQVWGHARATQTRAVDMAITRLRRKIERNPAEPEHLLTSRGDGYRLQLALERRTNLGPSPNRFFGRDDLLARLGSLLEGGRLVTLLGAPGAGKTRVAREFGRAAPERFAEVWFCDLVPVRDVPGLCLAVSAAVGVELVETEDAVGRLGQVFAARPPVLLVLDNGEHLEPLAGVVEAWVGAAPGLSVLVTSQRRLGLLNEALAPVDPLGPDEARALFEARAHAVGGVPEPSDRIDALLSRLDRLPLAIELAAVRTRSLRVDALEAFLDRRLEWLRKAPWDPDPRHESLWRALAWSWEALEPDAREVLTALAVFRGGFDADAAGAVLGGDALAVAEPLEDLQDRSLLQREGTRFRLLESVRLFVEAHGRPDVRATAAERHLRWYTALARSEGPRLSGSHALDALSRLSEDAGNLDAAHGVALVRDGVAATDLALALDGLFRFRGSREERLRVLHGAREALGAADRERMAALEYALGLVELRSAPDTAREHFHAAEAQWRRTDPLRASLCVTQIAYTLVIRGRPDEAIALLDEMRASAVPHPLGDTLWIYQQILHAEPPPDAMLRMRRNVDALVARDDVQLAISAVALAAQGSQNLGLTEWTREFADRLEALLEKVPERRLQPVLTLVRATDLTQRGLQQDAVDVFAAGLADARVHANQNALVALLQRYGITAIHAGHHALADTLLHEALASLVNPFQRAFALGALGASAVDQGATAEARRNLAEMDACLAQRTSPTLERARAQLAAQIEAVDGNLSEAADLLGAAPTAGTSTGQHANRAGLSAVMGARLGDGPLLRDALADLDRVLERGEVPGIEGWRVLAQALRTGDPEPLRADLAARTWHTGPRIAARLWLEGVSAPARRGG
ncbi:MAG: winged helix-turn-helix domain-containing protein [Myxococcota bacterium]